MACSFLPSPGGAARREMGCSSSQTCLIHRARFYLPHHLPPLVHMPSCHIPRSSGFETAQEKGRSDRRRKQRSEKPPPPPPPATDALVGTPADVRSCVCVCVCCFWLLAAGCPQCCLLTYDRPSPSSRWIGRIERGARAPPPHTHAGRKDLTTTAICFPSFSYAPYLWWRSAVCAACVLYV